MLNYTWDPFNFDADENPNPDPGHEQFLKIY